MTIVDRSTLPPIRETDLDRFLKLIPTEVLTMYLVAITVATNAPSRYFPFVLFLAGAALVPLTLYLDGRATHQSARWPQHVVRTLTFAAWANATSSPFAPWVSEQAFPWLRSLAVLVVPLVGAFVLREPPAAPPP